MFCVSAGCTPPCVRKLPTVTVLSRTIFGSNCTCKGAEATSVAESTVSASVNPADRLVSSCGGWKKARGVPAGVGVGVAAAGAAGGGGGAVAGGAVAGGAVAGGLLPPPGGKISGFVGAGVTLAVAAGGVPAP